MIPQSLRQAAIFIWEQQLGKPYLWGGDDPMVGFDCSGLVLEGLQAVGILPRGLDFSADALAKELARTRMSIIATSALQPGCLLFWSKDTKIYHVEIVWAVINDTVLTIGASGGGSATTDPEKASAQNAYVKIRPAKNWSIALDPF